jgi:putative addiction module component (TIGR02574 family)
MTALQMETVLKMPVERRILWVEDVWDSIRPGADQIPVPESHKRELDRRLQKYQDDPSALFTEQQLKEFIASRR